MVSVSVSVMALPAILLIDSDTANWQLQNVSQQKSGNVTDLRRKMQMVLERTWSKAAPNEMVYLFHLLTSGSWTDKPRLTKRRLSVCTCTLESSRVTVWDLNGLTFPICSNTLSPFASHLHISR